MHNPICKFVSFGEVLIDIIEDQAEIGGAPLNLAVWLSKLGHKSHLISGVGQDDYGDRLLNYIESNGISGEYIYKNPDLDTGTAKVILADDGSAVYEFPHPCAWDKIPYTSNLEELVENCDAFCFSTLPARDPHNFDVLSKLINFAPKTILDINLRYPHYSEEVITSFCKSADLIKLNDDELSIVAKAFGIPENTNEKLLKQLKEETGVNTWLLTLGAAGATVFHNDDFYFRDAMKIDVVDTVGAGDSFLAAFINHFINEETIEDCLDFATKIGAYVASHRGANPDFNIEKFNSFLQDRGMHFQSRNKLAIGKMKSNP